MGATDCCLIGLKACFAGKGLLWYCKPGHKYVKSQASGQSTATVSINRSDVSVILSSEHLCFMPRHCC